MSSYLVAALRTGVRSGEIFGAPDIPSLTFGAPVEFRGEEGVWTPPHFFTAAVATCFLNTFEAIAEDSQFRFQSLVVTAEGFLERPEGNYRFTRITLRPKLIVSMAENQECGRHFLEDAKRACLISKSILSEVVLEPLVIVRSEC
jgi:organic hydroperoxide reductase OsmC/OhrA